MNDRDEMLVRAQMVIKALRERLAAAEQVRPEPVAIVGMACRFPSVAPGGPTDGPPDGQRDDGEDLESFWRMTLAGESAERPLPEDRWVGMLVPGAHERRPFTASFLKNVDLFDAGFFDIAASEAMEMDPAQRLFLEVAWHALQDAGQTKELLEGSETGVFVGHTGFHEYLREHMTAGAEISVYTGTGNGQDVIAGRLAYVLNSHGPAMTVNTACSSSLSAIHLARRSLLAGECRLAVAGGVNILGPVSTAFASQMGFMAPDGRCKVFDERADGFGRGEGCGVVVLKRLSDAKADGDLIHAVIHGSAMNQDGRTNGLTAPNGRSQAALMQRALADAGIAASQVGYVEAHGTGTPLGDLIEFGALAGVYGVTEQNSLPCALGSVKANVGHQEGAAGVAGLIRAVLAIERGVIPPLAGFQTLNSNISLDETRLVIPRHMEAWSGRYKARYAGVSSFGWSGTNAHVILGETPAGARRGPFALSGRTTRVSAYKFQRSRYWIPKPATLKENAAPDDWFFETVWIEQPITHVRETDSPSRSWLIFADENGVAQALAQTLAKRGDPFVLVWQGSAFRRIGPNEFEIDAADYAQVQLLFQSEELSQANGLIVVHMQGLDIKVNGIDNPVAEPRAEADFVSAMEASVMSLIQLCRGLAERTYSDGTKLWVVTRGAQAVRDEDDDLRLAQSPIQGFAAAAAFDHGEFWGGTIDLPNADLDDRDLSEIMIREFEAETGENRIAYREGKRFVSRLRRAQAPQATELRLEPDATYLVTGAFGGIGLDVAEWLAKNGSKYLVLVGRSGSGDETTKAYSTLRKLREAGVHVRVERCDVAAFEEMSELFARLRVDGPPIRGILHAAADVVWKPAIELDAEDVRRSFHAKVRGSLVLHELMKNMALDFFVFFSSAAASIGSRNAAAYAAGNSFMDALASERRSAGLSGLSVQWGHWKRRKAHSGVAEDQFTRSGLGPMPPAKAMNALGRPLQRNTSGIRSLQPLVAQLDVDQLMAGAAARNNSLFLSEIDDVPRQTVEGPRPAAIAALEDCSQAERVERLTLLVAEQLRRAMDWRPSHPVDAKRGFFDMGMESLKSIQFKNHIEAATGILQSSTLVFVYPNVDAVVDFLYKSLFGDHEQEVELAIDCVATPVEGPAQERLTDAETHAALLEELKLFKGGQRG